MGTNTIIEDETQYKNIDKIGREEFEHLFEITPLTHDTTCGYGWFKGRLLQKWIYLKPEKQQRNPINLYFIRLASKKMYVLLLGLSGCMIGATYSYFSATISTLEKLFKIPSRNTGVISVGNDVSSLLLSSVLGYYCGSGHRPRWIAFGIFVNNTDGK